jgi:hypothetical protein
VSGIVSSPLWGASEHASGGCPGHLRTNSKGWMVDGYAIKALVVGSQPQLNFFSHWRGDLFRRLQSASTPSIGVRPLDRAGDNLDGLGGALPRLGGTVVTIIVVCFMLVAGCYGPWMILRSAFRAAISAVKLPTIIASISGVVPKPRRTALIASNSFFVSCRCRRADFSADGVGRSRLTIPKSPGHRG